MSEEILLKNTDKKTMKKTINLDEVIKKINLIVEDYKKYNFQIEEDRNKIYYKNQPGKLIKELNNIYLDKTTG